MKRVPFLGPLVVSSKRREDVGDRIVVLYEYRRPRRRRRVKRALAWLFAWPLMLALMLVDYIEEAD